jgi:hypothetical protein
MQNFRRIGEFDPRPALAQLDAHPELWGENPERTNAPGSPHAQSLDIWLRFRAREELTAPERYGEPHFASFYPAWSLLPALHPLVFDLMRKVGAVYLGGIMLTRLPAGARILPHHDDGWHARFMNCKCYCILAANACCINFCGDEAVTMRPGESWQFRNDIQHSVENNGDTDRIAMICTMRVEGDVSYPGQ